MFQTFLSASELQDTVLIIRIIEVVASIILSYLFLYCLWYIVRGRHKKAMKEASDAEAKPKENKPNKKDKNSPDYCSLNEIMGYEFITIQQITQKQRKDSSQSVSSEEPTDNWSDTNSPHMKTRRPALDVTSSQASQAEETPIMPDPTMMFNTQQRTPAQPAPDAARLNHAVEKTTENKHEPVQTSDSEPIGISENEILAMTMDNNPWPENEQTEDESYINWLTEGYEQAESKLSSVEPTENEPDNIYSLNNADEEDFDALLSNVYNKSDVIIQEIRNGK